MKASLLDLRRKTGDILRALEQNETVTISYRGRKKGIIYPAETAKAAPAAPSEHPAFGMWRDRKDLKNVEQAVDALRKGRTHGL